MNADEIPALFVTSKSKTLESLTNAIIDKSIKKQKYMSAYVVEKNICIKKVSDQKWITDDQDTTRVFKF